MEVLELRPSLLSNTGAVFALTALVLMLPLGLEAELVGITATMTAMCCSTSLPPPGARRAGADLSRSSRGAIGMLRFGMRSV